MRVLLVMFLVLCIAQSCSSDSNDRLSEKNVNVSDVDNIEAMAEEFCDCYQNEGLEHRESCLIGWEKKYGKIEFDSVQISQFKQLINGCLTK